MSQDYHQLMQEQLDGALDSEHQQELLKHLQSDAQAAEDQEQLEQVHHLLQSAPAMRASSRLAATIMATVPIALIPFAIFLHKEHVSPRSIIATIIAVTGVAMLVS